MKAVSRPPEAEFLWDDMNLPLQTSQLGSQFETYSIILAAHLSYISVIAEY